LSVPVENVVLFDGVCVLCDRSMRFLLRIDRRERLRFAPLQGETARGVNDRHPEIDSRLATVVYIRGLGGPGESVHERSDAAVAILRDVGGLWPIACAARIIPGIIRDGVYDWIANRRYRWFGKLEACQLPDKGSSERFLP
jgi:predicted DCC family thiol-disulfide oxidoreductase YuxK